jgi:hypothetical protein
MTSHGIVMRMMGVKFLAQGWEDNECHYMVALAAFHGEEDGRMGRGLGVTTQLRH